MMIYKAIQWYIMLSIISISSCTNTTAPSQEVDKSSISIIPKPISVNRAPGNFQLTQSTVIIIPKNLSQGQQPGNYLRNKLQDATGYSLTLREGDKIQDKNNIILSLVADTTGYGNKEGYRLEVSTANIRLTAPSPHGLFNGVQSLLQLFPPQILQSDTPQNVKWTAPAVTINDYPRFHYRGMHLDVARHFFNVKFVKRYIDLMAMYKMNRFHWHLTDDQGWRIEIKKYPKLTSIGAWRDSTVIGRNSSQFIHRRTGGFYTQQQIREVVEYAQKRFVTVIPEIDMPGHASAALAAYPEFGCKEDYQVRTKWGPSLNIFCPSEDTFTFLENVLTEVMELFPSEYIHIGGDEARKAHWEESELAQKVMNREGLANEEELQSYFIGRIGEFVNNNNRRIIGWNEIMHGGVPPGAMVQSWQGVKPGIRAANQHHEVIMSPNTHYYLSYFQGLERGDPIAAPAEPKKITPLKMVYKFDPIPDVLTVEQAEYIQGVEGALWSEYLGVTENGEYRGSTEKAEYMTYPRALAIAETAWSLKGQRNWNGFWRRLQSHFNRFDVLGINYNEEYKGQMPLRQFVR